MAHAQAEAQYKQAVVAASQEQRGTPDIRKAQAHPAADGQAPQFAYNLNHPGNEQGHPTSAHVPTDGWQTHDVWRGLERTEPAWIQQAKSVPPGDLRAVQTEVNFRATPVAFGPDTDANFQSISEHPELKVDRSWISHVAWRSQ